MTFTVGAYGPSWTTGILAEHLTNALAVGAHLHKPAHGRAMFVTGPDGWDAVPVLCGEIIAIDTEDGRISGRCGERVERDGFACPGHTEAIESWRGMSEAEKCAWERSTEEEEMSW